MTGFSAAKLKLRLSAMHIPLPEQSGYILKPHFYPYSPPGGALTPNQVLPDVVPMDPDADFLCIAWFQSIGSPNTFTIDVSKSNRYLLFTALNNAAISQNSFDPTMFPTPEWYPKSGGIPLNLIEINAASPAVQLIFCGVKLFRAIQ